MNKDDVIRLLDEIRDALDEFKSMPEAVYDELDRIEGWVRAAPQDEVTGGGDGG